MALWFVKNRNGMTVYLNGKSYSMEATHVNYDRLMEELAVDDKDEAEIESLLSISNTIKTAAKKTGTKKAERLIVESDAIYYKSPKGKKEQLHGVLVDKILDDIRQNGKTEAINLVTFLDNLMKNPRSDIRGELYEFLMSGNTVITDDGCFLAYKKVNRDFTDIYTGKMDNSPGKVVTMDESKVDTDRTNVCSSGLHFCTYSYLANYGSAHDCQIVIVKINPRHVGAIPTDYRFAKGRCSEYYVVGVSDEPTINVLDNVHFVNSEYQIPNVTLQENKRPSLSQYAEAYGFAKDGQVYVADVGDGERDIVTSLAVIGDLGMITKKPVVAINQMSIQTKSVISLLKRAVAIRRP